MCDIGYFLFDIFILLCEGLGVVCLRIENEYSIYGVGGGLYWLSCNMFVW